MGLPPGRTGGRRSGGRNWKFARGQLEVDEGKEGWKKEGLLRGGGAGSFTQPGLGMAAPSKTVTPPSIATLFLAFLGPHPLLTTTDSHISGLLSLPLARPHPRLWLPLEGPWLWAVGQLPWS